MADNPTDSAASTEDKAEQFMDKQAAKTAEAVGGVINEKFTTLEATLTKGFDTLVKSITGDKPDLTQDQVDEAEEVELGKETEAEFEKRIDTAIEKRLSAMDLEVRKARGGDGIDAWDVLKKGINGNDDPVAIRVKNAVERFDDTKTAATYQHRQFKDLYNRPITYQGVEMNKPTPRKQAMVAAWMKFKTYPEYMTDHDKDIVQYILHNEKFFADDQSTESRKLTDHERAQVWNNGHSHVWKQSADRIKDHTKALIDDSTSGGQHAVPEFFDTTVIITPVLGNMIAPLVDMMDVPRGSAAQGFQMGNLSLAAANTEGSAVSLFTTTGFIVNHDTTFFRAAGFIEIGQNFLLDAVPQMGAEIMAEYMRVHGTWLDQQIATGDGTTEPQGIIVASGTTDITPANPSTNTLTIGDVLELLFGVALAFRRMGGDPRRAAFGMTDSTYQRIRSIATGVTGDTRLVFGMDVEDYMLFNHPVAIEENGLTNADIFFSQLWGYKLYRRQGPRPIRAEGGDTLTRQNSILLGLDCRYGGQLKRGGYAAVIDSASA